MKKKQPVLSIILPTYNEKENIRPLIEKLTKTLRSRELEILVVDDDSPDGTADLVRELAHSYKHLRLIRRVGRAGLASAIKEGLLDATGDLAVVMDCDGQHDPETIERALVRLQSDNLDLVIGSRFHLNATISGLSQNREAGSSIANRIARISLPKDYAQLTDYMTGFFAIRINSKALSTIRGVEVNGFKFLYELLSISRGRLKTGEVPLNFQERASGESKLDISILWDFMVSALHTLCLRILPRRAISFGLVGISGVAVQVSTTFLLMEIFRLNFKTALPVAVISASCSNYLINNALTFRFNRLKNGALFRGLFKFLVVSSLPVIANVGLATTFYAHISSNTLLAQLIGILVAFVWNYAASSKFVWNTP